MPVFYFDYNDGAGSVRDHVGTELRDIDAALTEASQTLAELAADAIPGSQQRVLDLTVRDGVGDAVMVLSLNYHVKIMGDGPQ